MSTATTMTDMNHTRHMTLLCFTLALLAACDNNPFSQKRVRDSMPSKGELEYRQVVYVENDGRCADGQVIKVTGGSRKRDIPRQYECMSRP